MSRKRQIFRVGTHTPVSGTAIEFTEPMLRAAAAAYDPSVHEAPIVIGHPKGDLPAYGWIKSLEFVDGHIIAEEHQLEPQFVEAVDAGRYKKVSAAWYMPDAPNNPKPGTMYLKHVGYLGAAAPAIKGLRTINFSEDETGVVEFGDWSDIQNASLWRRMREFLIEKFGRDETDKVIPDYEVKSLEEASRAEPASVSRFNEPTQESVTMTPEEIAAREAELNRREAGILERETRLQAQQSTARRASHVAFVEGLITDGRVLPAQKEQLVTFMASLADDGVLEFGEGDQKTTQPQIEWLQSFLRALPKVVEFGEHARTDKDPPSVDMDDSKAIGAAALAFQEAEAKAGREIDIATAVTHIKRLHGTAE